MGGGVYLDVARLQGQSRSFAAPWLIGVLLLPWASAGAEEAGKGVLQGVVEPAGHVRTVTAVARESGQRFPGSSDSATGRFVLGGLPLEAAYDCIIEYADPQRGAISRLEGVDMRVPRSDYEEEQPLSEESAGIIQGKIRQMNRFEDVVEILAIDGNIQHAVIVVNKLRTEAFYDSKPGEVVWRLELWHYECPEETWHKAQDELSIVLYRERIQRSVYDRKSITLDPGLGGLRPTADVPKIDLGKVALPPAKPGICMRAKERPKAPDGAEL